MLTTVQIERIITDAIESDEAQSLNRSPASIAAEKIAELTQADANMLVAAQTVENEVTSHLVDLVAATVLATLIYEEGGGRSSVAFSPHMMDEVVKNYTIEKEMHGMLRNVRITLKPGSALDKEFEHDRTILTDPTPGLMRDEIVLPSDLSAVKPQAQPHDYGGPYWVVAYQADLDPAPGDTEVQHGLRFLMMHDRADAERQCRNLAPEKMGVVQNRYCLHATCPSTGCTEEKRSEATSKG